jgi:DNA-binding transcriptional ArsR family regulator
MAATRRSKEKDFLKALTHPMRRSILSAARNSQGISPKEIADKLDIPLSNVSYHVRILELCGAFKLVGTRPVRGSVEHFYRFTIDEDWALAALDAAAAQDNA